jgi:hypothetical protein
VRSRPQEFVTALAYHGDLRQPSRRRDYLGLASLLFAVIHLSSLFAFSGGLIFYSLMFLDSPIYSLVFWAIAPGLALTAIVWRRGKSIFGFTTLGVYAAVMTIRLFGLV